MKLNKNVEKRIKEWSEDPEVARWADFTTEGFAYYDLLTDFLATELANAKKEVIKEIRNWTKGKTVTKDKLRELLNQLNER